MKLAKYHAIGNDFLVLLETGLSPALGVPDVTPEAARALCDRCCGVGADGVLTLGTGSSGALTMRLRNADGSPAETSGNGLRCAALAALHAGIVASGELVLETLAGPARARLVALGASGGASIAVAMGRVRIGELYQDVLGRSARRVDVGNPHLVLYASSASGSLRSLRAVELAPLEHGAGGEVAGGLNVEAVEPLTASWSRAGVSPAGAAGGEAVRLVVWERGAGATLACGSGSVAAAAALRAAGLVGDRVEVHNPGGVLLVELSGAPEAPQAELTGPAQLVAHVEVDLEALLASSAGSVASPVAGVTSEVVAAP